MAADRATHQLNRRTLSGSVKATLVALGLIAAGILALTVAENTGQPMHAVATAAPQSFAATSNNGANAPDKQLSTEEFLSSNVNDKISSPISGPRECRPEQGIVNDCTYQ
jgi:uncharacterized membrane protein